jgi:hypothetical protein
MDERGVYSTVMRGPGSLRALTAFGLAGALLALLMIPPCAPAVCSMDDAAMAACNPLESDCCQSPGEQTAPSPLQVMPLALLSSPLGTGPAVVAAAERAELPGSVLETPAPPAILQDVGLHTFLAVFLI